MMHKILIDNHELEFGEEFVRLYEDIVCDNFACSAKTRLKTNYKEDIETIFREHTEKEIRDMIVKTAQMEIDLISGMLRKYKVFGGKKTIELPVEVLNEYEEKVSKFTENTANYFMEVLELTEDMSEEELSAAVVAAMKEDCKDSEYVKTMLSEPAKREELFHA